MATTTPNIALRKPALTDPMSLTTDLNDNWDKIDNQFGSAGHDHSSLGGAVKRLVSGLASGLPASGTVNGQIYFATDTRELYLWNGTVWVKYIPEGAIGQSKLVRKTADEIVNNSTVFQNDDHLVLSLGASEVWYVEAVLIVNSSLAADIKFQWTYPAGTTISWEGFGNLGGSILGVSSWSTWGGDVATQTQAIFLHTTTSDRFYFLRAIVVVGTTAGNLQLQWAQYVAEASNTIIRANSFLKATRLA